MSQADDKQQEEATPSQEEQMAAFEYDGSDPEEVAKSPAKKEGESSEDAEKPEEKEADDPNREADKADTGEEGDEDGVARKKARQKSIDERFREITGQRREALAKAEKEEERRREVEAREDDLKKEIQDLKKQLGVDVPEEDNAPKKPSPKDYQYGELDDKFMAARDKYVEDMIDYRLSQAQEEQKKEREIAAASAKAEERQKVLDKQIRSGLEKYDDFEVKLESLNELPAVSEETVELLLKSPQGADILYHLASNPEEAQEMVGKSPIEQALHIGKLEAKYSSPADAPPKTEPEQPKAKAPAAPPPPSRTRGADGRFKVDDSTPDFAAFQQKHGLHSR